MANPVYFFEIPVGDLQRAVAFYETVFGFTFEIRTVDGHDMAFFPRADDQPGASGALAVGEGYTPSHAGCLIYFDVPKIDDVLRIAQAEGARVLYPKTDIGEAGFVAEIEDSEGNRIGLNEYAE
ncbi:VOC family protein [Phaeobacter sp.]|uniref:VOC family protein n=1 Tax=Phaeobacter sp. TaxID=1902409 RepID=UPI0025F33A56|nr:VOC family protein [Phaeobacter sp.]